MKTIKVKAHIDSEGILKLEVPTGLSAREVMVTVIIQTAESRPVDANGWPIGFFDHTYGVLDNGSNEHPPQLPSEEQ